MKKNSVAGAKAPAETIGIDVGDKRSRYCVLDEAGTVVEEGSFWNRVESIRKHFGGRSRARVALEAGTQSAWMARELKALGHEVMVAHPRELRIITASDRKSDRSDAEKLARVARLDPRLLNAVEHRSQEQQLELGLIRARDALVRARSLLVNAARGLAKNHGCRLPSSITETFGARARTRLPEPVAAVVAGLLDQIDALSRQVRAEDKRIDLLAERHPEVRPLTEVHGVGTLTALTFVLTLGRKERFAHSRDVGAYLGLRPRRRQSGERDPRLGISKAGNGYLRKLLVQCAHHVLGHFGRDSALRRWGNSIAGSGGGAAKKRAIVAVARKLAVLLHRLWTTGEPYEPFPAS
jgi:transposase